VLGVKFSAKGEPLLCSQEEKQRFLRDDFYHSLKELFISAITWQVAVERETGPQRIDFQKDVSMHAAFAQARALYEFYTDDIRKCDDARAAHFCGKWKGSTGLHYARFMEDPANKRIFHLVYCREREWLALKSQVMNVAKELCKLSEEFVRCVRDEFREGAQDAWARALKEAQRLAAIYEIQNPFTIVGDNLESQPVNE
jgi:hypothetical protein